MNIDEIVNALRALNDAHAADDDDVSLAYTQGEALGVIIRLLDSIDRKLDRLV